MVKVIMKNAVICLLALFILVGCKNASVLNEFNEKGERLVSTYVAEFNAADDEIYVQEFKNTDAEQFLLNNIPFFECPDKELERTYYFRWWTYRKHIKATPEGYIISEFLPDVPWAGKYNAISCPGMHQFSEGRWLSDTRYLIDYAAYWCREKNDARRYSFPIAYSFLKFYKVHPNLEFIKSSYPTLKEIYTEWEKSHWDEHAGLFWQMDGRDGMEVSLSGELSNDKTGYRATINSYMYADAVALAQMAEILGEATDIEIYKAKAELLKKAINEKLWDDSARFYKVIPRHGDMSFSPVRELHGYIPWMFGISEKNRADAWLQLSDPQGFKAPYGPTTAEQRAKGFKVIYEGHECQWNGPSWPFATAQTLTALARTIHRYGECGGATKKTYFETLLTYSKSHRRANENGQTVCWIDENLHPFTGDWISRTMLFARNDKYRERGKDYNHSSFCDLVISGLIGVQPQMNGNIVILPLIPEGEWDWFALSRIPCAGKELSIIYDRTGQHYGCKPGMTIYLNGKKVAHTDSYSTRIEL